MRCLVQGVARQIGIASRRLDKYICGLPDCTTRCGPVPDSGQCTCFIKRPDAGTPTTDSRWPRGRSEIPRSSPDRRKRARHRFHLHYRDANTCRGSRRRPRNSPLRVRTAIPQMAHRQPAGHGPHSGRRGLRRRRHLERRLGAKHRPLSDDYAPSIFGSLTHLPEGISPCVADSPCS